MFTVNSNHKFIPFILHCTDCRTPHRPGLEVFRWGLCCDGAAYIEHILLLTEITSQIDTAFLAHFRQSLHIKHRHWSTAVWTHDMPHPWWVVITSPKMSDKKQWLQNLSNCSTSQHNSKHFQAISGSHCSIPAAAVKTASGLTDSWIINHENHEPIWCTCQITWTTWMKMINNDWTMPSPETSQHH